MKYLLLALLLLSGGCITMNPCPYCRQRCEPDIEHNESVKLGDGYEKIILQKTWIYYMKVTP